jgi:hypothetical protein
MVSFYLIFKPSCNEYIIIMITYWQFFEGRVYLYIIGSWTFLKKKPGTKEKIAQSAIDLREKRATFWLMKKWELNNYLPW